MAVEVFDSTEGKRIVGKCCLRCDPNGKPASFLEACLGKTAALSVILRAQIYTTIDIDCSKTLLSSISVGSR
jgi:hypothetical protein